VRPRPEWSPFELVVGGASAEVCGEQMQSGATLFESLSSACVDGLTSHGSGGGGLLEIHPERRGQVTVRPSAPGSSGSLSLSDYSHLHGLVRMLDVTSGPAVGASPRLLVSVPPPAASLTSTAYHDHLSWFPRGLRVAFCHTAQPLLSWQTEVEWVICHLSPTQLDREFRVAVSRARLGLVLVFPARAWTSARWSYLRGAGFHVRHLRLHHLADQRDYWGVVACRQPQVGAFQHLSLGEEVSDV